MSSNQENSAENAETGDRDREQTAPEATPDDKISESEINHLAELRQARKDRLAKIKADVEAGAYDSEEILDAALERMFDRVIPDEDKEDDTKDEP